MGIWINTKQCLIYRIDASHVDSGMARWINDQWKNPNAKMKKVLVDNTVHLCLFAQTDIAAGKEIRYDYGVTDLPWRKEVSLNVLHDQEK